MNKFLIILLGLFVTTVFTLTGQGIQKPVYLDSTDAVYGYYEYLPLGYDTEGNKEFPLVIFLHGLGEKGNGNSELSKVAKNGPPKKLKGDFDLPAIVISPQSPVWWNNNTLDIFLDWLIDNYRVNEEKIYMTGLSMGGGGTWDYAVAHAEKLAAIVPVCGASTVKSPGNLADLPVWAFHNSGDKIVSVNNTYGWINGIEDAGGEPKMTIYQKDGHDAWTATYNNQEMWDWMFAQPAPPSGIMVDSIVLYPSPLQVNVEQSLSLFMYASDTLGNIDSVHVDLSALGGPGYLELANSGNVWTAEVNTTPGLSGQFNLEFTVKDDSLNEENHSAIISVIDETDPENFLDSVLVNFNYSDALNFPWNNMNASPTSGVTRDNFMTVSGMPLKMEISAGGTWGGQNDYGTVTGDDSGIFPDSVIKTSWYVENSVGIIHLKNLDPAFKYVLKLFGSRSGTGNRMTRYVVGSDTLLLDASKNTSVIVEFPAFDLSGNEPSIDIQVLKKPDALYAYVNAMVIIILGKPLAPLPVVPTFNNPNDGKNFNIYPNPMDDFLNIVTPIPVEHAGIYNLQGYLVKSCPLFSRNQINMDVSSLCKGVYIIEIITTDGNREVMKVLKH